MVSKIVGSQGFQAGDGLLRADAGARASDHVQPPVAALIERAVFAANERLRAERQKNALGHAHRGTVEGGREHSDDGEQVIVEQDGPGEDVRVGAVLGPPEIVRQDSRAGAAAAIVVACEGAAQDAGHPERLEIIAAGQFATHDALLAPACKIELPVRPGEDAREDVLAVAHLFPDGVGEILLVAIHDDFDELFGMADRQHSEHDGVDQAEDGGVGADAQAERNDGYRGESGIAAEGAQSVAEILR